MNSEGVDIGMNKVTRIPAGATRRLFSLLFVLILSVLQIPTIAFASANADREGYDMRICLNKTLSSRFSRIDDKFTATVVDAGPFNQAKILGHIEDIKQSGRFKGATEMYLSFDRIRLSSGETFPIGADIIRLYDVRSGEQVDAEGGIETSGRGPQTLKRSGIGALAGGIFGIEFDLGYTNNFYATEGAVVTQGNLLTAMPALVIGIPIGGQTGGGVRPYFVAGAGLLKRDLEVQSLDSFSENDFGYTLGGGLNIYFSDHVGIRGDYRYFRNFSVDVFDFTGVEVERGTFDFSRASVGVLFRF